MTRGSQGMELQLCNSTDCTASIPRSRTSGALRCRGARRGMLWLEGLRWARFAEKPRQVSDHGCLDLLCRRMVSLTWLSLLVPRMYGYKSLRQSKHIAMYAEQLACKPGVHQSGLSDWRAGPVVREPSAR